LAVVNGLTLLIINTILYKRILFADNLRVLPYERTLYRRKLQASNLRVWHCKHKYTRHIFTKRLYQIL